MRDAPTELTEADRFKLGRQRIERCGVCKCIPRPRTEHRAALSGSVFVTFCGSYYCEARAVASLEYLRDSVSATGLPDLARRLRGRSPTIERWLAKGF